MSLIIVNPLQIPGVHIRIDSFVVVSVFMLKEIYQTWPQASSLLILNPDFPKITPISPS